MLLNVFRHPAVNQNLQRSLGSPTSPLCNGCIPTSVTSPRPYQADSSVYGFKERPEEDAVKVKEVQSPQLLRLVTAYRDYGHLRANTDPLKLSGGTPTGSLFDAANYGLSQEEATVTQDILSTGKEFSTLEEVVKFLEETYCGPIGAEFAHLQDVMEKEWLADAIESSNVSHSISLERRISLANLMLKCQAFDHFLAAKFSTVKRYGGEGAETMMAFFDEVFAQAAGNGLEQVVMCMPHRGRNNLLTSMLNLPPALMFRKLRGKSEWPDGIQGSGDVLSHLTSSTDLEYGGKSLHVTMIPNPSHLEANNPVAVGKTRARQQSLKEGDYSDGIQDQAGDKVLCLQVHGDASFAGQGIVPETFCLAYCPHYRVGGSIHMVVNNQVGYTTEPERGRSSLYCSDVGKMINCPVFHVNADYPEEVIRATKIACDYRQKFRKDIIIDLVCFRRWGHNEMDDPTFTQPLMYKVINSRSSTPDLYAAALLSDGTVSKEQLFGPIAEWQEFLNDQLKLVDDYVPPSPHLEKQWTGLAQPTGDITTWDTGLDLDLLKFVGSKSVAFPESMNVHERLLRYHIDGRLKALKEGKGLDWATGEALAFGSLLLQGYNLRISGQDVGRGTFSQRHAMLVDQESDKIHIPLNHILEDQTNKFEVANSILSEEAVLGFEYGFSIENPANFVIWEAQFGDFFNGAQIIIDTYLTSGEAKWLLQSSLTMLLPHGYDGMGPEHTSCRVERFLQMTDSKEDGIDGDNVNFQVANPTTPAQYYHLLRRQMLRNFRKPLVVMSPKMLLRYPACVSHLSDLAPGTHFQPVLPDVKVADPKVVTRVLFVCGKHYYALDKEREAQNAKHVAIVRLEEICPFPAARLQEEVKKYANATEWIWAQEEQRNSGVWTFVAPRFQNVVGVRLHYVGRGPAPTPATAVGERHKAEAEMVISEPFKVKL